MPEKIYLTKKGHRKFKNELSSLIKKEPELIKEVQRTAAMGDRSENAGYQNAKSQLRKTQGRIRYLERLLRNSKIVDESNKENVQLGSTVTLLNLDTESKEEYTLVDVREIDPSKGNISKNSPLGRNLLNKRIGNVVEFEMNGVKKRYNVLEIN